MTPRYRGSTVPAMNQVTPADSDMTVALLMLVLLLIAIALILPRLTRGARSR